MRSCFGRSVGYWEPFSSLCENCVALDCVSKHCFCLFDNFYILRHHRYLIERVKGEGRMWKFAGVLHAFDQAQHNLLLCKVVLLQNCRWIPDGYLLFLAPIFLFWNVLKHFSEEDMVLSRISVSLASLVWLDTCLVQHTSVSCRLTYLAQFVGLTPISSSFFFLFFSLRK